MKKMMIRPRVLWIGFTAFCWLVTPFAFQAATIERGYDAIGGEALIPLLPIIAGLLLFAGRKSR